MSSDYIHGTHADEQQRLTLMNGVINGRAIAEMKLNGQERILDVGSGLAQFTRSMARATPNGPTVIGVERDAAQVKEAHRQAEKDGESDIIELRQGDATSLPLSNDEWGSFDVVHSRFLLEHLPGPLAAVKQMARAVKSGGRVILQDDDHDVMRLWPPLNDLSTVCDAYARAYQSRGTDGYIGRKLPHLLHQAGLVPTYTTWLFYGACAGMELFEPLLTNLEGILVGARTATIAASNVTPDLYDRAIDSLREWRLLPGAALWYSICWAEARPTAAERTRTSTPVGN